MSILVISNMYPSLKNPSFGVFVRNLISTLEDNNLSVFLCVRKGNPKFFLLKIFSYLCFYSKACFYICFRKYEYIYIHYVSHSSLPVLLFLARLTDVKIVSHVHGTDVSLSSKSRFYSSLKRKLILSILNCSYKVFVPSVYYRNLVSDLFSISPSKIYVTPSGGVDLNTFSYVDRDIDNTSGLNIIYAGRLEKLKRVEWVIEIAKHFKYKDNIRFKIIGDGSQKEKLIFLSTKYDLNISFYNSVTQSELASEFMLSDILLYPSERESLGLVPLEAMSTGVVPFVSNIPAFREYISDGFNGYICDNILDFIRKIDLFISLSGLEKYELSKNSNLTVLQSYDKDKISKDFVNEFKK